MLIIISALLATVAHCYLLNKLDTYKKQKLVPIKIQSKDRFKR